MIGSVICVCALVFLYYIGGLISIYKLRTRYFNMNMLFSLSTGEYVLAFLSSWIGVAVIAYLNRSDKSEKE